MNIFFPKKEEIECDPYRAQLINNYLFFNTGYVKINNLVLNDILELKGGDTLGYKINDCYNVIGVFARGTGKYYLIDRKRLKLIKELEIEIVPQKLYLNSNYYYLTDLKTKINTNISEIKDYRFYLFYYKFSLTVLISFLLACLCTYFLKCLL